MNILFTKKAWDDYIYWQAYNKQILKKLNLLIKECSRDPFKGIGKPEALLFDFSGWWSRRIDYEHRLIYKVEGENLVILRCRDHY